MPAIKREIMNKIVRKMSEKQNNTSRLNAGMLREAVTLVFKAISDLSQEDTLGVISAVVKRAK